VKLESGRITTFQYMLSVVCYIQSSALLTSFFTPIVKQDSWLVVLFGMAVSLPVLLVYAAIMRSFPGMSLIEICQTVFGKAVGSVVSLIFIWFFLTVASLNLSNFGSFMRQAVLVETPTMVVIILMIVLCAYAVEKGLKVITRYAPIFVILAYALTLLGIALTLNIMNFDNFLPMLNQPISRYIQSTNIIMTVPFGELVVFLMITPHISRGKRRNSAYLWGGFLLGGTTLLFVVLRDTAVLGNVGSMFAIPPFETLRLVNLGSSLNRLEILFAILLVILLFFKIAFLYYVTVLAFAQLFKLKTYHPLVLIVGVMIIAYSTIYSYHSTVVRAALIRQELVIIWLLFEFLLPLAVLIAGRARGLHKQAKAGQSEQ